MDSCCGPRDSHGYNETFDSRFSRVVARQYGRKGLGRAEQSMVDFLVAAGIQGASVLEVGGGIGELQIELLKRGAAHSVNLELSRGYEEDARRLIAQAGLVGRVERRLGVDIAETPDDVEPADVVVLHRVVCCYPDYAKLLGAAASRARRAIVFSYPTANPLTRAFLALANAALGATGRSFRGYVHSPQAMIDVVRSRGLEPTFRWDGFVWRVAGAVRAG